MNINNVTSSTLLDMLSNSGASKTDDIFATLVQNNNLRCQKRLEQLGITTSSSENEPYKKVSASAANVSDAVAKLADKDMWNEASKDYDEDKIKSTVSGFVSAYNTLFSNLSKVGNSIDNTFRDKFNSVTGEHAKELEGVGITIEKDGRLTVDEEKLKAADVSELKKIFGPDSDILKEISTYADDCSNIISKAFAIQNSMSGLYNASSDEVNLNSGITGSAFDITG